MKLTRAHAALALAALAILLFAAAARAGAISECLPEASKASGLVVVMAEADPAELVALARARPVVIEAWAPDAAAAARWAAAARQAGVYGQVTARLWDASAGLGIADNTIAEMIVDPAYIGAGPTRDAALAACRPGGRLHWKAGGGWETTVKPRPAAMADWPMYNGDNANSLHSPDTLVGPANGLQWIAGPTNQRLPYVFVDDAVALTEFHDLEADRHSVKLIARDAFSGLPIWDRLLEEPANRYALVMDDGKIYLHRHHYEGEYGGLTVALNANTGELIRVYDQGIDLRVTEAMVKADRNAWRRQADIAGDLQLRLADGVLTQSTKHEVVALDAKTGERLWSARPEGDATYAYPTIGRGVFFIHEGPNKVKNSSYTHWPSVVPNHIRAMDLKTGAPRWTWTWNDERHGQRATVWNMQYENGRIASAMTNWQVVNDLGHKKTIAHGLILDAATGGELYFGSERGAWPGGTGGGHSHVHMLLRGDTVFTTDGGAVFGRWPVERPGDFVVVQDAFKDYGMRPIACALFRSTPAWWVIGPNVYPMDLTDKPLINRSGRSGCDIGAFPANGMIYVPPNTCACQPYLPGTKVYHSREPGDPVPDDRRLTVGPGKPAAAPGEEAAAWPQFFQGPARRLWVGGDTPLALEQKWRVTADPAAAHPMLRRQWDVDAIIRGPATAGTVAEGVVCYALPHARQIVALDAATGEQRWRTPVEGRVDLPPSIHRGMILAGTRDGYVYALSRDAGEVIWRFFAAPTHQRIMVNGQLESAWPVFGAVPVEDVGVYVVAGRHTSSDGGLWWYLLDDRTGAVKNRGRWNELAVRHTASIKGYDLPLEHQPIQNSIAIVSDHWLQLPRQAFRRNGVELTPNTDWELAGLDLKTRNIPDRIQREDRALRFGDNTLLGEPIQTAGGWRKPRFGGTLARLFAIDPDDNRFVSVGGGPKTASGRGGGGDSAVHLMRMLDKPVVEDRTEMWSEVIWEADDPLFQHRGERRAITAIAASDNAVYLGATVRNDDRRYQPQRTAMPYRLRVLDLATGEVKQDLPLPETTVLGGVAIAAGRVYVTTEDGSITAFGPP